MRRRDITPRQHWILKVEDVGLIYHHTPDGVYWDESACLELSMREVEEIETATSAITRWRYRPRST